jgi:hypothetical protein
MTGELDEGEQNVTQVCGNTFPVTRMIIRRSVCVCACVRVRVHVRVRRTYALEIQHAKSITASEFLQNCSEIFR